MSMGVKFESGICLLEIQPTYNENCLKNPTEWWVQFLLIVYNGAGLQVETGAKAFTNDRKLYRTPVACKSVDHEVAEATRRVIKCHI